MSLTNRIYDKLPIFLQNVACSWRGRHLLKTRYNENFHRLLGELNESQWWELEKLQEYQNAKVRELMKHVHENVPYYNRVMKERGLTPKDFETAEDLKKMPYLTKDIIRREGKNMIAKNVNLRKDAVFMHTSGTTGAGLKYWTSNFATNYQWAVWWRHRNRFGIRFGMPHANFGVNLVAPREQKKPPFWRENRPLNQTYCSLYHLSDEYIPYFVEMFEKHHFVYYVGYPSGLFSIADYLRRHNHVLDNPPKIICTGAETLLPLQRERFQQWLGAPSTDQYGLSEGAANASRCIKDVFHVDMEFCVLESKKLHDTHDGYVGLVIGTGLHNFAHPFIRYLTADVATFSKRPCECGMQSPIITYVDGRIESYITTPDGRRVGLLDSVFKDMVTVREAQLIQKTIDHVLVKIVPESDFNLENEKEILAGLKTYLGCEMSFSIEKTSAIAKSRSGKLRFIISEITPHLLDELQQ